jgi:hypothetical protein
MSRLDLPADWPTRCPSCGGPISTEHAHEHRAARLEGDAFDPRNRRIVETTNTRAIVEARCAGCGVVRTHSERATPAIVIARG